MKCQHCGNELKENAKFCDGCGAPVKQFVNSVQHQFVANNNFQQLPKKKGLRAWHILLIVLGSIFALIGLFFCFVLWICFTFGTTESELQTQTTQAVIASTESNLEKYTLDSENSIGDITYFTPSEFRTTGTKGSSLVHFSSKDNDNIADDDKIFTSYIELDIDTSTLDDIDKREMIDILVDGFGKSEEGFVEDRSVLTKIKGCYGVDYQYHSDLAYVHLYAFLYERGCYVLTYSTKKPFTEENEQLFTDVIDSIVLN